MHINIDRDIELVRVSSTIIVTPTSQVNIFEDVHYQQLVVVFSLDEVHPDSRAKGYLVEGREFDFVSTRG